jgi:hypoxanthine phosphoribosyltransferase
VSPGPAAGDDPRVALLPRCRFPAPGSALACAVSGGADSLALLALAAGAGLEVTAVHVDHGLRPGSAGEAEVVAAAARRFGADFRARSVRVAPGPNLEARARAARLAALPPGAATGHTMDDQAETVLLNLLRGSGPPGLAAMAPGPTHPLLGLRRSETRALCRALGLAVVEDPSNQDPRHARNRVRHEVLPLLAEVGRRDPVPLLSRAAGLGAEEAELVEALSALVLPDPADARALAAAPAPLARRALRRLLRDAGATPPAGRPGPAGRQPPRRADVERVLAVARGEGRATEVAGGHRIRRRRGRLEVELAPGGGAGASGSLPPVPGEDEGGPPPGWAGPQVGPEVVSARALAARVAELGAKVSADYAGDPPLLVGVLKGAMVFMSDLCRAIELPVDLDFMAVSSYGSATHTSGVVRIVKDLDAELTGRHVLVVEDIIDSGLTLNYLRRNLQARHPASVEVCALLVKAGVQRVDLDLRYVGFTIPNTFVVGYGLDVAERFRNLPGVHTYLGEA